MSNLTAIILAAGQGTRLRPLTNEIPKCMVEIAGKPILNRQLDVLSNAGVKDIIVVTGYKEEKIDDPRITKVYNKEYASTNMIYSLFCAEDYLDGNVIICYGDIIYSGSVLEKVIHAEQDIVIASDEEWHPYWESRCEDPLDDAETFQIGANGKVKSLGKNADSLDEIEGQFIGLLKLSAKGVQQVKEAYHKCHSDPACKDDAWQSGRDLRNAYMTDLMNYFASQDQLYYTPIQRGWFEVDNQTDLAIATSNIEVLETS